MEMDGSGITVAWNREAVQDFVGANRCFIGITEVSGSDFGSGQESWALRGSLDGGSFPENVGARSFEAIDACLSRIDYLGKGIAAVIPRCI
jgi:hypothetical protein